MRLYANDMVMSFSSRIRRYGKVAIDLSTKVRQFKFDLFFGAKNEKSYEQMKCRMHKKGPLKPFERPQHHFLSHSSGFDFGNMLMS